MNTGTIKLEEVTFGGTKKHLLKKKDSNQWNPSNEDYGTNYSIDVPNKAWTRDPAFSDPICYTRSCSGSDCTATIVLSIEPSLSRSVGNVDVNAILGNDKYFEATATFSGDEITVGPMNLAGTFGDEVDHRTAVAAF